MSEDARLWRAVFRTAFSVVCLFQYRVRILQALSFRFEILFNERRS